MFHFIKWCAAGAHASNEQMSVAWLAIDFDSDLLQYYFGVGSANNEPLFHDKISIKSIFVAPTQNAIE